ncbi:MAG: Gfo/Idh/MocA family oxidoreductase, partial [Saprospiraceae bacterium]
GAGHLGKVHIKCWKSVENIVIIGFYDPDTESAKATETELGIKLFDSAEELIKAVDIVDIVATTSQHFALAMLAMDHKKSIFIEKPLAATIQEAEMIVNRSKELGVLVQVGHVERFNPAFLAVKDQTLNPQFIEAHRLANFNPRGTDVAVVLDLMIHDLDIILELVGSEVVKVHASGVSVVSETEDICNARIEFANGCIANITASRISFKKMRKMRLFQKNAYISLDFLEKEAQIIRLIDDKNVSTNDKDRFIPLETSSGLKWVDISMPEIQENNAIQSELASFVRSVSDNTPVEVPASAGLRALYLADQILVAMKEQKLNL